ncbi:MAG: tetratricopeptide repeat protein, partial [Thermoguttaceae bacterium]|nr:tetratricopeptide repeat protein [Thermoguttaceae bacterium]
MKRLGVLVATTCALAVLAQCLSMAGEPAKDSSPAGARSAEATAADSPLVAEKIRQAMQDRDYAAALKAIDEAMAAKDAPHDYLLWLKGRALHLAGQHDEAIAVFESVEKQFPTSPWVRRARFAKGATLARKGDFRAAEMVYRAEADYLLSADRKQQIADLYLEFADAYFKPPKEEQKPDYAKALEFYTRALDVGPKPEKRAEVELLVAQCQQKLGKFDEAIGLYEKFIREHPTSPLDLEARYNLGDCQLQKGDRRAARRAWQDLLAKYPDARTDRIAEAAFRIARTWGIPPVETAQAANPPAPNGPGTPAAAPSGPPGEAGEALNLGIAALEAFLE